MIVLGILLVVVGVVAIVGAIVKGDATVLLSWHHYQVRPTLSMIFLAGAATLFVVELGVLLMRSGSARRVTRWRELSRLRRLERERARSEARQAAADEKVAAS